MIAPVAPPRRRLAWALLRVLAPLLAGCLTAPVPTPVEVAAPTATAAAPPLPPAGGRIAFLSDRTAGRRELWIINPDGSHATALLPGQTMDAAPVWSPDGTRLAYVAGLNGKSQIGVLLVNADNTPGQTAILTTDAQSSDNTLPAWSPDNRQLAFQSNRSGAQQIYVMPAVGGPAKAIANQPPYASWPAWAPDGKTLVFAAGVDVQHTQLYSVPADGSAMPAPLTNNDRPAAGPVWAPDGKSILFLLTTSSGTHNIVTIHPDGTGQHELTSGPQEDIFPVWSPDSAWIAFFSDRGRNEDVFVLDAGSGALTNISDNPAGDLAPTWAPDSRRLAFSSNRDGAYRLYIAARDGTHLAALTSGSGDYGDGFPVWSSAR